MKTGGNIMDGREQTVLTPEERKRRRIERRKRELRIARIKFAVVCGLILLAIILIIVGCTKGCKKEEPVETTVPSTEITTTEETEPPAPTFAYSASDWKLILVNSENPLPEDYSPELTTIRSGAKVNSQCMDSLQEMIDDCRAADLKPLVLSAYLTEDEVQKRYETRVSELMSTGQNQDLAEKEARRTVEVPGCNEYQTGMLLDIVSEDQKTKDADELYDNTVLAWFRENSWKYGFVERYTEAQADRMGKIYQPWMYRYVGTEAAKDMFENDYCLEELLTMLDS